jgi:two-component system, chemotaxis family, CheB/CheR fusion protein
MKRKSPGKNPKKEESSKPTGIPQESQPDSTKEESVESAEAVPVAKSAEGAEKRSDAPETGQADSTETIGLTVETAAEEQQTPALMYPIVGIGASAGGLPALQDILKNLDSQTGMAFVLVTHLAPDQKSFLSEIVEPFTQMPVVPVEHGQRPEPNHLYVLLPNQTVSIHGGMFRVEPPAATDRFPRTIDRFFLSLANDQKNHAIGVVLSGANADGALGLKAIKGEGGITLVQSPESAVHGDMPRSSIASDHVDLVVPPAEIGMELNRLGQEFARPQLRSLGEGITTPDDEQSFQRILQLLRGVSGLDLRQYKPETVRRRIARRMILLRRERLADYARLLQARPDELRILQEDVLINVTRFFRDLAFWDSIRENVLPILFQDRAPDRPIRIWCAGCSSGEEVYSLAISVLEYQARHGLDIPLQIFGTDASDQSIEAARMAIYSETVVADLSPERLRRYFVKVDRGYQVSKRVRDTCIFSRQNLASDPPFSHIDLLSCRNVMIYFNQALQRQVMLMFHYALESGGYILLGMSEGLRDYGDVFTTVDRKNKIYMKTGIHLPYHFQPRNYAVPNQVGDGHTAADVESSVWPEIELQRAADRIVMARFGPPGLVIDERMNVLQSRGQTAPYLEITPGAVNWNLQRLLREGIVTEVKAIAQRAISENVPTSTTVVMLDDQAGQRQVLVDVLPITSSSARARCFLILFQPVAKAGDAKPLQLAAPPKLTSDEKDRMIAQLRQDLNSTRFHLQTLVEERDARHQELVSANEEIQSANEELQSTNEELETTKEELQSANEELQTVNDELQQRNNVLMQTGNDLTNLLNSVNIPLLMLTSDLHIRQFTPPMQRLLSVRPSDVGRSISEIRLQLSVENIEPILTEVLESLGTREMEVQDREGRWHLLRVRPYRTAENKIEGLVVVLVDIDQLRKSQQNLVDARDFASSVVESVPVPIVVLNTDCTIRTVNTSFRELVELKASDLEGRSMPDLFKLLWGLEGIGERLNSLAAGNPGATLEIEHESTTQQRKSLLIKAEALSTDGGRVLLLMVEDITLRRTGELLIARQKEALEGEIEVAARRLSRTQEELRGLTGHLLTAQEEERQYLARELHDDISQRLSALKLLLDEMTTEPAKGANSERLHSAQEQVESLNNDVRQISHRLHPSILSDLGLSESLRAMVQEFGDREKMPATYLSQDLPEVLPQQIATPLYRIAQEALRNVSKHAGKTHVKVALTGIDGYIQLKVMDFGTGFDQEADGPARGLGMISMHERARLAGGELNVQSTLGQGTTVTVEVPVAHV